MVDTEIKVAAAAAALAYSYYNFVNVYFKKKILKKWKKRRWWVLSIHRNRTRDWINAQRIEFLKEPLGEFKNFHRMSTEDFEFLLSKIAPIISKKDTQLRDAIPAKVRLAITLQFLATGDSYKSLHFQFKVSSQSISKIVPEVCSALNQVLKNECKLPSTAKEWLEVERGFKHKFPHVVGVIDGKHVVVRCPPPTASDYYNYKGTFSVGLLAVVDSDYCFIFADVGVKGRTCGGNVFQNCLLRQKMDAEDLNLPAPCPLPGTRGPDLPYVFLGDTAFDLHKNLINPYPGNHDKGTPNHIFNNKLSSCRVYVDNVFGILAAKFRIFKKPLELNIESVEKVVLTCILLHNFLRRSTTSRDIYNPSSVTDVYNDNYMLVQPGSWRQEVGNNCAIQSLPKIAQTAPLSSIIVRENFRDFFYSEFITNNIIESS